MIVGWNYRTTFENAHDSFDKIAKFQKEAGADWIITSITTGGDNGSFITAVGFGKATPIPSYIFANTGTTLTNMKALTVIATVNIIAGYIKADLIFFLIFSFFSSDSTILSKKTSNLPLASPALIKLT